MSNSKSITIRIPEGLAEALQQRADESGSSLSQFIATILQRLFDPDHRRLEESSRRYGESIGYQDAADWCRKRARFLRSQDDDEDESKAAEELEWASQQFDKLASSASKQAKEVAPATFLSESTNKGQRPMYPADGIENPIADLEKSMKQQEEAIRTSTEQLVERMQIAEIALEGPARLMEQMDKAREAIERPARLIEQIEQEALEGPARLMEQVDKTRKAIERLASLPEQRHQVQKNLTDPVLELQNNWNAVAEQLADLGENVIGSEFDHAWDTIERNFRAMEEVAESAAKASDTTQFQERFKDIAKRLNSVGPPAMEGVEKAEFQEKWNVFIDQVEKLAQTPTSTADMQSALSQIQDQIKTWEDLTNL